MTQCVFQTQQALRQLVFACGSVTWAISGCANPSAPGPATAPPATMSRDVNTRAEKSPADLANVRYQVADVDRAIAFYTRQLGFKLEQKAGKAFASVVLGDMRLILSGPGSSGARPLPDGRHQEPGGWNRIVLYVDNLSSRIDSLKSAGIRFRNNVEAGPGGTQIQIEDPDGNPIELHEAPK